MDGLLAINGVLDYLEIIDDEPLFVDCVKRFADWLMSERTDRDGVLSWGYQHGYWGTRQHQQNFNGSVEELPSKARWHQDNIGRLMAFCALRFNRADYLDAWAESFAGFEGRTASDHGNSASLQFLPWVQAAVWRSTLGAEGELCVQATHFGPRTFAEAEIRTPDGPRKVTWLKTGHVQADPDIVVDTRALPAIKN